MSRSLRPIGESLKAWEMVNDLGDQLFEGSRIVWVGWRLGLKLIVNLAGK